MKSSLEILLDAAAEQEVQVLVIGGQALPAYGVTRQTVDLDCLVEEQASRKLARSLARAGYGVIQETAAFVRYRHASPLLMDLDVMLVDGWTFEQVFAQSSPYYIEDREFRVPCLAHLIALKLHAIKNKLERKSKDLRDIMDLLGSNKGTVSASELKALCERFGPADIYEELRGCL